VNSALTTGVRHGELLARIGEIRISISVASGPKQRPNAKHLEE
jgi:hypothetical protein